MLPAKSLSPSTQSAKPPATTQPAAAKPATTQAAAKPGATNALKPATTQTANNTSNASKAYFQDSFSAQGHQAFNISGESIRRSTLSAPVQQTGWVDPTGQGLTMQQYYSQRAMDAAGIDPAQWDPSRGFQANRENVERVYQYYTDLYNAHPELRWAGMGKLAGGTVMGGLEIAEAAKIGGMVAGVPIAPGEAEYLQQELMGIQKDIFNDLAWQHQLYAEEGIDGIRMAAGEGEIDATTLQAWEDIASGDESRIWAGNTQLLYREQHDIIQPSYDRIQQRIDGPLMASFSSWLAESPVPGGQRFTDVEGFGGNVMSFDDRWNWIANDMLPAYQALPVADRDRLINTPLQDLANDGLRRLAIEFGLVIPAEVLGQATTSSQQLTVLAAYALFGPEAGKSVFDFLGMGN